MSIKILLFLIVPTSAVCTTALHFPKFSPQISVLIRCASNCRRSPCNHSTSFSRMPSTRDSGFSEDFNACKAFGKPILPSSRIGLHRNEDLLAFYCSVSLATDPIFFWRSSSGRRRADCYPASQNLPNQVYPP